MHVSECNWMQIEAYLKGDDRAVLPIGSTEQHAYLSLSVDAILAERVSREAAEPLGIPVFPTVSYGISPYYMAFPGTVTIRTETMLAYVRDILDSLARVGFRRILVVNGHGGNNPVQAMAMDWMVLHPECSVRFHNWWNAPKTWAKAKAIDPVASHASWLENFPWTRVANVAMPREQKPMVDVERMKTIGPAASRDFIGDGNYGGYYQRSDEEMLAMWNVAVEETRTIMREGWR